MSTTPRIAVILLSLTCHVARADVEVHVEQWNEGGRRAPFQFRADNVPAPSMRDSGAQATFAIVDGEIDRNGGGLDALHDDKVPMDADQPGANFFFGAGSEGGRLHVDLGAAKEVRSVRSYSWHPGERGPQVYTLYASDGEAEGFNASPKRPTDPTTVGWKRIARVDTRAKEDPEGGLYGVSIADPDKPLGRYRHLLFDIERTGMHSTFDQTFYGEIDVVTSEDDKVGPIEAPKPVSFTVEADGGKYELTFELTDAPDLEEWTRQSLVPVVTNWYPKLVAMLPSDGFTAPDRVTLRYRTNMGGTPASAGGSRINLNATWFRRNLEGEARGSVVHEMVHVVQQYGRARRTNPNATRTPGWITEGIPDYIRWFLYEPETKGAEITRRNLDRASYDASYRITGNFLDWVTRTYDKDLSRKLNAAAREGRYEEALWKEYTGKSLEELGREWKEGHQNRLAEAQ